MPIDKPAPAPAGEEPSEALRAMATEWLGEWDPNPMQQEHDALVALLAAAVRQARLEEANWWYHKFAWPPSGQPAASEVEGIDRIAALEREGGRT